MATLRAAFAILDRNCDAAVDLRDIERGGESKTIAGQRQAA